MGAGLDPRNGVALRQSMAGIVPLWLIQDGGGKGERRRVEGDGVALRHGQTVQYGAGCTCVLLRLLGRLLTYGGDISQVPTSKALVLLGFGLWGIDRVLKCECSESHPNLRPLPRQFLKFEYRYSI